jgi:SAM-dependent methyltransferase
LGREVIGIDVSPGMIDAGRRLNPGLPLEVGDMRALRFANGTFAAVLAFYSIIHFAADELPTVFGELRRVLRADGLLAVAFHIGGEVRHVDELWGIRTDLDFVFFEPDTVVSALAGAGFSSLETTTRAPYDAAVEAQTTRCYLTARVA